MTVLFLYDKSEESKKTTSLFVLYNPRTIVLALRRVSSCYLSACRITNDSKSSKAVAKELIRLLIAVANYLPVHMIKKDS